MHGWNWLLILSLEIRYPLTIVCCWTISSVNSDCTKAISSSTVARSGQIRRILEPGNTSMSKDTYPPPSNPIDSSRSINAMSFRPDHPYDPCPIQAGEGLWVSISCIVDVSVVREKKDGGRNLGTEDAFSTSTGASSPALTHSSLSYASSSFSLPPWLLT